MLQRNLVCSATRVESTAKIGNGASEAGCRSAARPNQRLRFAATGANMQKLRSMTGAGRGMRLQH
jgi:hypothetical protein